MLLSLYAAPLAKLSIIYATCITYTYSSIENEALLF
uniref:Uncharacterized protein n=1 Tax=Anguilla anguilla TaxID=7936 RepID=A0A0E9URJ6_ANGAN